MPDSGHFFLSVAKQEGRLWEVTDNHTGKITRQGTQGWCTGMTLRDEMRREVGGRVKIGNTCTPKADSCECMAKTSTIV